MAARLASPTEIKIGLGPHQEEIAKTPVIELVCKVNQIIGRKATMADGSVIDYVPSTWLAPAGNIIDVCVGPHPGKVKNGWISAPRGHGKTDLVLAAIIKSLALWPDRFTGYFAHTERFVKKQAGQVKRYLDALGWKRRDSADTQVYFEFPTNGGFLAAPVTAVGQGHRFKQIIIDDPFASYLDAQSQAERERIIDIIENDLVPMLEPDGSILLVHSRFHVDDPVGYFKKAWGPNSGVNIQAITTDEDGNEQALWKERFPLEDLKAKKKSAPTVFSSQFQGEPRSVEGTLFTRDPATFDIDHPPTEFLSCSGVDLAFSGKANSRGDWSVRVRMLRVRGEILRDNYGRLLIDPSTGKPYNTDKYYIVDVIRKQMTAPDFAAFLRRNPDPTNGKVIWHLSGIEKGTADYVRREIPRLVPILARVDKHQWATPLADAWNDGRVLVPTKSENSTNDTDLSWVEDFVSEVLAFQGIDRETNDQVDAAASAFFGLQHQTSSKKSVSYIPLGGSSRTI